MSADTQRLDAEFKRAFDRMPGLTAEAPGRVNLIGEHTDYNDGFVLPVAIDRTVAVAAAPREDNTIRAYSLDFDQHDEFPVDAVRRFLGTKGGWRDYVRGVAWALADANVALRGADIAVSGDVPCGAGLSSSAAIEVATAGALLSIAHAEMAPRDVALACQKAENLFVGVQCGIMDQFASALGREGHALLIDCRSLEFDAIPLPDGISIVVIDSKVERRLSETAYNQRREECAEAAAALGVESLREAEEAMLERLSAGPLKRARHVVTENQRVLDAVGALHSGDLNMLGLLLGASHASLRADFEVSTPELDLLVDLAVAAEGAIGARLTGAGFGGCTVNLVRTGSVDTFRESVAAEYHRQTGLNAEAHVCRAVDGLRVTYA